MTGTLIQQDQDGGELATLSDKVREYIQASKAQSTTEGYRRDWRGFTAWCEIRGLQPLPANPETVAAYLADRAETLRTSTLRRHLAAIAAAHRTAGRDDPTKHVGVQATWQGIRRTKGVAPSGKAPAITEIIRRMVTALPGNVLGVRDRALILLGFAGAFRRSELVALDCEDIEATREGLVATLRRSKTDQEGVGRRIGIPYGSNPATCPVRAVRAWLADAAIDSGPLFRPVNRHGQVQGSRLTAQTVALIVKRYAAAAGLDPRHFSGHSLRAGHATAAAAAGVSERVISRQTGHRSQAMLRRYIREATVFQENSAASLGL